MTVLGWTYHLGFVTNAGDAKMLGVGLDTKDRMVIVGLGFWSVVLEWD